MSLNTFIPHSCSYFVCVTAPIQILELYAKFKRLIKRDMSKHAALKPIDKCHLPSFSQTGIEGHEEHTNQNIFRCPVSCLLCAWFYSLLLANIKMQCYVSKTLPNKTLLLNRYFGWLLIIQNFTKWAHNGNGVCIHAYPCLSCVTLNGFRLNLVLWVCT